MAFLPTMSIISFFLLASCSLALQVTPNSPCAPLCLAPGQDVSDPNLSNITSSDITCIDANYDATVAGKRFQSCVSCLQASSATGGGETDQAWFLYNLRYTLSSCLFGFGNATDAISTPCSDVSACGPLQQALENDNLIPENQSEYSYCSADNNAFLGASLPTCISCLRGGENEKYLANFMTALQAGCNQRPEAGTVIGIQGNVFSSTPVNITDPGSSTATAAKNTPHKGGLSQGAIIGLAVGLGVLLITTIAILFVCFRKRRNSKRMSKLQSPLDPRFGAKNITSPHKGDFGNPYASPPITVTELQHNPYSAKELAVLGHGPLDQKSPPTAHSPYSKEYDSQEPHALSMNPPAYKSPTFSGATMIPTHQAYIPNPQISPAASTTTTNTYQTSFSSAHSSPRELPPAIAVRSTHNSPRHIPDPIHVPKGSQSHFNQLQPSTAQLVNEGDYSRFSPPAQQLETRPPSRSHSRAESIRRDNVPPPIKVPRSTQTSPKWTPPPIAGPRSTQTSPNYISNISPPIISRSTHTSPKNIPAPIYVPRSTHTSPKYTPPPLAGPRSTHTSPNYISNISPPLNRSTHTSPNYMTDISPPANRSTHASPHYISNISPPASRSTHISSRNIPTPIIVPPAQASHFKQIQPSTAQLRNENEKQSQISPPILQSEKSPPLETRPPSRSQSRADSVRRVMGIGAARASKEQLNIQPVSNISGPIVYHGGRFDFELAEQERREREGQVESAATRKKEETPISAASEEMWPGSY